MQFVTNFKQLVRSTAGDYWRIDQGLLSSFCDFEMIFSRLQNLASNGEGHLASDAAEAIQMLERDR